jgi:hypothetical protein
MLATGGFAGPMPSTFQTTFGPYHRPTWRNHHASKSIPEQRSGHLPRLLGGAPNARHATRYCTNEDLRSVAAIASQFP